MIKEDMDIEPNAPCLRCGHDSQSHKLADGPEVAAYYQCSVDGCDCTRLVLPLPPSDQYPGETP